MQSAELEKTEKLDYTLLPFAFLIFLISGLVLFGWFANISFLVQIHPDFAPMQFNTALGFMICGISMVMATYQKNKILGFLGSFLILLAALTLCEYFFSINLGIDDLIIKPEITTKTVSPGRMAPNTALCFLVSGFFFLTFQLIGKTKPLFLFVSSLPIVVLSLGSIAFIGYLANEDSIYGWSNFTDMALHTSFLFICLGFVCFLFFNHIEKKNYPSEISFRLPLNIFFGVLVIIFSLWSAIDSKHGSDFQDKLDSDKRVLINDFNRGFKVNSLLRKAKRWETEGLVTENQWKSDADYYILHSPIYRAIVLTDSNFGVIYFRKDPSEKELVSAPALNAYLKDKLLLQKNEILNSGQGYILKLDRGTLFYISPIYKQNMLSNFLVSVISLDKFVESIVGESIQDNYDLIVKGEDGTRYSSSPNIIPKEYIEEFTLDVGGLDFEVQMHPKGTLLKQANKTLPNLLLVIGFLLSLFLAFVIYLIQIVRKRAKHLDKEVEKKTKQIKKQKLAALNLAEDAFESKKILEHLSEDLQSSNEELDRFAYIASHDLKEPLRGIANLALFISEDYGDKLDDEGKAKLSRMQTLCSRLESFLSDLLYFSRVGRLELAIKEVNLQSAVDQVLDLLGERIKEESVEIKIPEKLPSIKCDSVRVKDLYVNLITNAIKYNDKDMKWVEIGVMSENNKDEFSKQHFQNIKDKPIFYVKDNGIGIKERDYDNIFQIFKRLYGRDKFGEGTGAGLTIVKKIVEKHGGDIKLDSKEGEGTCFYFTLSE